ncbi:MAG: GIY-YIG nuclease family protein [Elusimicrobia bacterium]|nr:GIY-YIG nuclease family protein [Elusimicrobiota bacterium]
MKTSPGTVIYVGKAKNLKKRISHYFSRTLSNKTFYLMGEARKIEYIITKNHYAARILEEKLIKIFKPKYNVALTDDKNYPYICLTDEKYPRLEFSRGRKTSDCFGPYPDSKSVRIALRNINRIFLLPACSRALYRKIRKIGVPESCMYFHTENCSAPCCGKITPSAYAERIAAAVKFLKGGRKNILKELEAKMRRAATGMNFEMAILLRNSIKAFRDITGKIDVIQGFEGEYLFNAASALNEIRKIFSLEKNPEVIDGIDISHIQGAFPVASAVRFRNGIPEKSAYRKYRINFEGIDDYAMIRELVKRRYKKEEPDLILVDGGLGQVSAVKTALLDMGTNFPVAGLAKREEILYFADGRRVKLPKSSSALRLLMYIRDAAHRFAVSFHRQRRRKAMSSPHTRSSRRDFS